MEGYLLYMIKLNVLAGLLILLVLIVSHLVDQKYSMRWRKWFWLFLCILLLLPVRIPDLRHAVRIQVPSRLTAELPVGRRMIAGVDLAILMEHFMHIWMAGIVLLLVYRLFGYIFVMYRLNRSALMVSDRDLRIQHFLLCKKMGIRHIPDLKKNADLSTPLLAGIFWPCIYLPEEQYEAQELEWLLMHELNHYIHKDLLFKMLLQFVCSVYWFNPLLWLMKYRAEQDVELICDEYVMRNRTKEERLRYNRLLIRTAAGHRHRGSITVEFNHGLADLKHRMAYIMKAGRLKTGRVLTACFVMIFLLSNAMTVCSVRELASKRESLTNSIQPAQNVNLTEEPEEAAESEESVQQEIVSSDSPAYVEAESPAFIITD